jgi:hypothetical protein
MPEIGGPALLTGATDVLYSLIQPAGRAVIGVWLWRGARLEETGGRVTAGCPRRPDSILVEFRR